MCALYIEHEIPKTGVWKSFSIISREYPWIPRSWIPCTVVFSCFLLGDALKLIRCCRRMTQLCFRLWGGETAWCSDGPSQDVVWTSTMLRIRERPQFYIDLEAIREIFAGFRPKKQHGFPIVNAEQAGRFGVPTRGLFFTLTIFDHKCQRWWLNRAHRNRCFRDRLQCEAGSTVDLSAEFLKGTLDDAQFGAGIRAARAVWYPFAGWSWKASLMDI